jgi:hypothetical protein
MQAATTGLLIALSLLVLPTALQAAPNSGCTASKCHAGIASIRAPGSKMMQAIIKRGGAASPQGCAVCHGGTPAAVTKEEGHRGAPEALQRKKGPTTFYPDPGSPWINAHTCGPCHPVQVRNQHNSLMMTEAGKIQGTAWAFGGLTGYRHKWANYDAKNPIDPGARLGTVRYRAYMERLRRKERYVFVDKMDALPEAPRDLSRLKKEPHLAAFTYLRTECQRCHLGVRGRQKRGDYRGMGCSACHIPYGNEGLYEGRDRSIPPNRPGHLLVHRIQGTREASVEVNGKRYSGIPVETCTTCHDRGKRIGVSFQGLMESAFLSPFTRAGKNQPGLHTKHYLAMKEDLHYAKGMLCQDCHSSIGVHGDGFLAGSTLGQVQIECADCHGTVEALPWELPLGYGDEFAHEAAEGAPRGLGQKLPAWLKQGTTYPAEGGYLLSARGNPLPNVVRRGDKVLVHTAGGKDLLLTPLKLAAQGKTMKLAGRVAMASVSGHLKKMECYACHGAWTPQCYGCHAKIDYSGGKRRFDWVAAGQRHGQPGHRADRGEAGYETLTAGAVTEQRSYMRWANPMLVINGEGRVAPGAPGCQVSATIIGADGEVILQNHIFRAPANTEGGGADGQLTLDVSPTQPHTSTGRARPCESCHASPKALGHGIAGGKLNRPWDKPVVVDLMSADRKILPRSARTQIPAMKGLSADWSRIVTEEGKQLQTVGHHFKLSRPLNNEERAHMARQGVCLSCHAEIPQASLAVGLLHHVAQATGQLPRTAGEHDSLVHKVLLISGWGQVAGAGGVVLVLVLGVAWLLRRRRRRRSKASD